MDLRTITKSWQQVGQDSLVSYNNINVPNSHRDGLHSTGRYRMVSLVVIFGPKRSHILASNLAKMVSLEASARAISRSLPCPALGKWV